MFLLSLQFLVMERVYIETLFTRESKANALFGPLCSGIAFSTEGVFFKRKRRLW